MIRRTVVDDAGLVAAIVSTIGACVLAAAAVLAWLPVLRFERTSSVSWGLATAAAACFYWRRSVFARRGKGRGTIAISAGKFRPGDPVRVTVRYKGTPKPRRFEVLAGMSGYVYRVSETRVAERLKTVEWREPFEELELVFDWTLPKNADPELDWSVWVSTEGGEPWLELHEPVEVAA